MDGEPVIPAPRPDDDDDVAWALQTAAVMWQRGNRADAVVWLRRAVDAAILSGNAGRTRELGQLAESVGDRVVAEVSAALPDEPTEETESKGVADGVDDLLTVEVPLSGDAGPRRSAHTLTGEIPFEFDGDVEDDDGDRPTLPPGPGDVSRGETDEPDAPFAQEGSDAPAIDFAPTGELLGPAAGGDALPEEGPTQSMPAIDLLASEPPPAEPGPASDSPPPLPGPESEPLPPLPDSVPPASHPGPEAGAAPGGPPVVDGLGLDGVRGLEDLPEEAQSLLASTATITMLSSEEEVGAFGAALVTRGRVGIMPSISDTAAAFAEPGQIVFTRGTLDEAVALRVVALEDGTAVASWSAEALSAAMADCPWVADELRSVADRFHALAGATLGPIGDRLDDMLRELVVSRLEVKAFASGEIIVEAGKAIPGLHVVGAGRIELVNGDVIEDEFGPGDFLFSAEVLSAGKAHATARAGKSGALVLFASRQVAQELLTSVPPLLEILAG